MNAYLWRSHRFKDTFFTASIRRTREGNSFSLSTLAGWGVPHPRSRWGYPIPGLDFGGYPIPLTGGGYLHPRSGWGVPPCPRLDGVPPRPRLDVVPPCPGLDGVPPRPISKASTCYVAGGVLLAFTQEDFLVKI